MFIRQDKRSMGKQYGFRNPVLVLPDAFEVIDRDLQRGLPLPGVWERSNA